jgi:protein TonB
MDAKHLAIGFCAAAMLAACSSPAPVPASAAVASARPASAPFFPPLTLDSYKKSVADRIASTAGQTFDDPMPEVLKSIVVLDITIDRTGQVVRVAVQRSNGYKALENRAIDSVKGAAPFGAPAFTVRRSDGSVNFLETFLFRDDGRFRILSLVR